MNLVLGSLNPLVSAGLAGVGVPAHDALRVHHPVAHLRCHHGARMPNFCLR